MKIQEFKNYIKSIGYKYDKMDYYQYGEFMIHLCTDSYMFYNGIEWFFYKYNDLTPFLKLSRSIKIKKILE